MVLDDLYAALAQRPTLAAILRALETAPGMALNGRDLCQAVYRDTAPEAMLRMRVNVHTLRRIAAGHGWVIRGRRDLGANVYQLQRVL